MTTSGSLRTRKETHQPVGRLERGRLLLQALDPKRPPPSTTPREFDWQYRALRERVEVYARLLGGTAHPSGESGLRLLRAERAIDQSLHYFENLLRKNCARDEIDGDA